MRFRTFTKIAAAALVLALPAFAAPLRFYVDRGTGVRFRYPATWLLNADDDAATAKLHIVDQGQPGAVVQLEGNFADAGPYKGTDFEAGAFAYVVVPRENEGACFAALDQPEPGEPQPTTVRWNGLPARTLDARSTVAGTDDVHRIFAVYRLRRCFLFETVIVSKVVGGPIAPLAPARWRALRSQFAAVLESVRIDPTLHPSEHR